jgi:hypothetical protein
MTEIHTAHSEPTTRHLLHLLSQHGYPPDTDTLHLLAALVVCEGRKPRAEVLQEAKEFFRLKAVLVPAGLETLPTPWLKALPRVLWRTRKPHWDKLPYMISRVGMLDGLLSLEFAQEQPRDQTGRITAYDRVRIAVNVGVYPSRFRPLTRQHARQLKARWPELGLEVQ